MANWENVMVDTDQMESGKFYQVFTNKDNATLTVPTETQDAVNNEVTELRTELNALKLEIQELKDKNSTIINNYTGCSQTSSIGGYVYIYDINTQKVCARMYSYNSIVIMDYLIDEANNTWQEMVRWS